MAALRAAVFPLSVKNRREGHFLPPSSARVKINIAQISLQICRSCLPKLDCDCSLLKQPQREIKFSPCPAQLLCFSRTSCWRSVSSACEELSRGDLASAGRLSQPDAQWINTAPPLPSTAVCRLVVTTADWRHRGQGLSNYARPQQAGVFKPNGEVVEPFTGQHFEAHSTTPSSVRPYHIRRYQSISVFFKKISRSHPCQSTL